MHLRDGHRIPAVGFGTYPLKGAQAVEAVSGAIRLGYRLIDTAVRYDNEEAVGEAVRRAGVPREDLVVFNKVRGADHGYDDAIASTRASLKLMRLTYLDLHLLHWPNPQVGRFVEAWRALVELRDQGLVKSIGVSNFTSEHLGRIIDETGVVPAVNQIEMHPTFPQTELRRVHDELGIATVAWSPLGRGRGGLDAPVVVDAANRCGVSAGQVILRWHLQQGAVPVPKSADPDRQRANLDLFGFELTADELAGITALGRLDGRTGGDPDVHLEL